MLCFSKVFSSNSFLPMFQSINQYIYIYLLDLDDSKSDLFSFSVNDCIVDPLILSIFLVKVRSSKSDFAELEIDPGVYGV